jgi:hypothetical protein
LAFEKTDLEWSDLPKVTWVGGGRTRIWTMASILVLQFRNVSLGNWDLSLTVFISLPVKRALQCFLCNRTTEQGYITYQGLSSGPVTYQGFNKP